MRCSAGAGASAQAARLPRAQPPRRSPQPRSRGQHMWPLVFKILVSRTVLPPPQMPSQLPAPGGLATGSRTASDGSSLVHKDLDFPPLASPLPGSCRPTRGRVYEVWERSLRTPRSPLAQPALAPFPGSGQRGAGPAPRRRAGLSTATPGEPSLARRKVGASWGRKAPWRELAWTTQDDAFRTVPWLRLGTSRYFLHNS